MRHVKGEGLFFSVSFTIARRSFGGDATFVWATVTAARLIGEVPGKFILILGRL